MRSIKRTKETLTWLPALARHDSGAVWCLKCDAPLTSCGSKVHNPNHDTDVPRFAV